MERKRIYLDHAATTPVDPAVNEAMTPYFLNRYGNASSLHDFGREAKTALDDSRETVAKTINASHDEIVFTSGGTESDNLAVLGYARKNKQKGNHIITSSIEHPAVLEACKQLTKEGFKVTHIPVNRNGFLKVDELEDAVTNKTILISVMHSNNEIGTLQPIGEIGRVAGERGIAIHTDAVQSIGKTRVDVKALNVDLLSMSAHKIYGPKGVGALYVKQGVKLQPLMYGGGHEFGLRSSTENVTGAVGIAKALELAGERFEADNERVTGLRNHLIRGVLNQVEDSHLTGHPEKRLSNNAHFYFPGVEGEAIVLGLDEAGIASSTGSACSSKKQTPSHVLMAMGLNPVEARGSLRLTLGRRNIMAEIDYTVDTLSKLINRLRDMSPVWLRATKKL